MRRKAIVAAAVASAFAWPFAASANSWDTGSAGARDDSTATGQRSFMRHSEPVTGSDTGVWEVATPYSPNESGPALQYSARTDRVANVERGAAASFNAAEVEVMTPFSPNETGPVVMERERQGARTLAMARSLPNPQTPASPNEVDAARPVDDMIAYREQLAGIEQAHAAVASATGSTTGAYDERSVVRSEPPLPNEPAGITEERQSVTRNDVTASDASAEAATEPVTPGRNEADLTQSQPALVQSHESLALAPSDRYGPSVEPPESADTVQTAPMAPESGVATPATPPSQNTAEESENSGRPPSESTM